MSRAGFEAKTVKVAIENILPTRLVPSTIRHSPKFKAILASIEDVGIIEPLVVFREAAENGQTKYILLDGHLRFEALKALGAIEALCLISTDDEGFTYNRQINRVSAVQEHRMIMQAIERNVPAERIAKALNVNVQRIRERQRLLDGIAPEAVELLKERMVSKGVFSILRKMKPIRQIEAAEMMISANRFSVPYATMILAATRSEFLAEPHKIKKTDTSPENIARMEREMEKLYQDYKAVEDTLGETMLVLVVAKGYVTRLLRNEAILAYLRRHYDDLTQEIRKIMEAVGVDARAAERE